MVQFTFFTHKVRNIQKIHTHKHSHSIQACVMIWYSYYKCEYLYIWKIFYFLYFWHPNMNIYFTAKHKWEREKEIKTEKTCLSTITVNLCQFSICHSFSYEILLPNVAYCTFVCFFFALNLPKPSEIHFTKKKCLCKNSYLYAYQTVCKDYCECLLVFSLYICVPFFFFNGANILKRLVTQTQNWFTPHFYRFCWK